MSCSTTSSVNVFGYCRQQGFLLHTDDGKITLNLPSDAQHIYIQPHTHTHLMALCPGLPGWAGTRKVNPVWILLKQVTVSGSGITWAICKSAPRSRQITMPAPHHSVFYRPDALPAAQPTASKHYSLFRQVMLFPIGYSPASCTSWFWFLLCFYLQDHHSEEFISPIAGYEIVEAEAGSRL